MICHGNHGTVAQALSIGRAAGNLPGDARRCRARRPGRLGGRRADGPEATAQRRARCVPSSGGCCANGASATAPGRSPGQARDHDAAGRRPRTWSRAHARGDAMRALISSGFSEGHALPALALAERHAQARARGPRRASRSDGASRSRHAACGFFAVEEYVVFPAVTPPQLESRPSSMLPRAPAGLDRRSFAPTSSSATSSPRRRRSRRRWPGCETRP